MRDYFGKDANKLIEKKLFLLDMDGTIYNDETIFDGTLDFLDYVKSIGGRYIFITNNSSKSIDDYLKKVHRMGIEATADDFYTSTDATIKYLKDNFKDPLIFASGTKSFIEGLKKANLRITTEVDNNADVILMGYDTELNYQKLINLCIMLKNKNAPYIATNPDLVCPVNFGFVPDCGSVAIMLKNATGRTPTYIGKPEPTMINLVCESLGYSKEDTVVIGDRLYTDIASGNNAHVDTICMLSGEATLEDLENDKTNIPTYIYKDIRTLVNQLKNAK